MLTLMLTLTLKLMLTLTSNFSTQVQFIIILPHGLFKFIQQRPTDLLQLIKSSTQGIHGGTIVALDSQEDFRFRGMRCRVTTELNIRAGKGREVRRQQNERTGLKVKHSVTQCILFLQHTHTHLLLHNNVTKNVS